MTTPSPDDLLARVREIAARLPGRVAAADERRDLPSETIAELREAGLLRLFRPARFGGWEADPRTFFDAQNLLAERCASTAWVMGVLNVQALIVALFDPRAQAEVWGSGGSGLVCSAFQPTGSAEPCDGGYRLRGRWSYASGSSFCDWAMLGAMIPPAENGQPPEMRLFLVPRPAWCIVDVWHTYGLRGTGSNDIAVAEAIVPAYRTHKLDPGLQNVPLAERPGPGLYRLPWLFLFAAGVSNFAIGSARGALAVFLDIARKRVAGITGKVAREDPSVQMAAARLAAEADAAETILRKNLSLLQNHVGADRIVPIDEALLIRTQMTAGLRRIAARVDELVLLAGARGSFLDAPLTRIWLDLCAARVHPGNDPDFSASAFGQVLIGGFAPPAH